MDGESTRAASAAKRHHVGSAPLVGLGGRNTAEGADTATSGGALGALADAASGGACFCAACARLADRVAAAAFALTPSLPARAQGHGRTSVSPPGVVAAVEEGEQQVPPLSSTGAVYPWRTARSLLLKAAPDAVETAEGHGVVLLLTFGQLLRKRDRCFHLPAGCPEGLAPLGKRAALLRAALRDTARPPPAAPDKTT